MSARAFPILLVLHAAVAVLFLLDAGPGFPLDDAWIHMVYARAFGEGSGFSYNPGQFETGVTAPLWTALMAVPVTLSDVMGVRPDLGVRLLGGLVGVALAFSGMRLAARAGRWPAVFTGLALTFDPLLVFDRFSGMEQPLFGLLTVLLIASLLDERDSRSGLLCGALLLTRPEALALAALAGFWIVRRGRRVRSFLVPLLTCIVPWMAYCYLVSGRPWPSTFDTKAEAVLAPAQLFGTARLLIADTGWIWALPLAVAVGAFSLEGGRRDLGVLPFLSVAVLLVGVLVSRPMESAGDPARIPYYWARYAWLGWPLVLLLAASGVAALVRTAYAGTRCRPLYAGILIGPLVLVLLLGRQLPAHAGVVRARFAAECAQTEAQNVAAGRWIAEHMPVDALVATHDAGAIRFFGRRAVLDIWGNHSFQLRRQLNAEGPQGATAWLRRQKPDALVVLPAVWAPDHSPELARLWRDTSPGEGLTLTALSRQADDWATLFGLTRRAETFHVDEPATIPSPLHSDLAIFVKP